MGGSDESRRRVTEVAGAQHGAVAHRQLLACGLSARQVEVMRARGALTNLHTGVYLLGPFEHPHTREMAAVLACGPGAVLSHRSAARLYRVLPSPAPDGLIDVSVSGRHVAGERGIQIHRSDRLGAHHRGELEGIPVTAPPRTLVDLAGCCGAAELEAAVAEAFALRHTNRAQMVAALDEHCGRRGIRALRALFEHGSAPKRTRSKPERTLLGLIRAAGLPEPLTNQRIGPWEVDMYWPDAGLVVEVDAYSTHSSPWAFERDRRKSAALADRGLSVHRVTALEIRNRPEVAVAQVRRRLARVSS